MATKEQELEAVLGSMEDISDSVPSLRALLFGESGTGKTVLTMKIAQSICPPGKKILYIDSAEGFATLKLNKEWHYLLARTDRMKYAGISQLRLTAKYMTEGHEKFKDYGVLVLDEASSMTDKDLMVITRRRAQDDKGKDPDTPKQPDMGAATNRWNDVVSDFNAVVGLHIIQVTHVRKDKDDLQIEVVGPSYMPKLSQLMRRDAHIVGHCVADQVEVDGEKVYKRLVQVQPTRRVIAKTRLSGLPVKVEHEELITACAGFVKGEIEEVEESTEIHIELDDSDTDTDDVTIID